MTHDKITKAVNHQPSELREFLGSTQMFQGLPADQLDALANIALEQTYLKNEIIFWEGDEGRGFFVVKTGKVKVFKLSAEGKEQILHFFGAGEHFAEVAAFDGQCFPASAGAVETTELFFFSRTSFLDLLKQHPNLAINMLAIFSRHLRRFAQLIEDLSLKEVPGRLAAYLLYLSEKLESDHVSSSSMTHSPVELDMTKAQLAAFLGTIPETLSRVFAKLSHEGLISIDGSRIILLDRERISVLAKGRG